MNHQEINLSIAAVTSQAIAGIVIALLPFVICLIWKRKTHAAWIPLLAGLIGYLVIGALRGLARLTFLSGMQGSPWMFYIWQAVLAGVFEEGGRYLIFRYAIPNHQKYEDAISYSIGHCGLESFAVNGITDGISIVLIGNFVVGLVYCMQGYTPLTENGLTPEEAENLIMNIAGIGIPDSVMMAVNAVGSFFLQAALSVLVFTTVHQSASKKWLLIAFAIHVMADILPAFHFAGNLTMTEVYILTALYDAAAAYLAYRVWEEHRFII